MSHDMHKCSKYMWNTLARSSKFESYSKYMCLKLIMLPDVP